MGGHGGLNILPQKKWNVYNFDNREKVKRDEEAAAKEEQLKQEQVRKRDAEFRLQQLRTSRGLAPLKKAKETKEGVSQEQAVVVESEPKTGHINLFEGIRIFDPIQIKKRENSKEQDDGFKRKKMKKEEVVITPEDEKYRLGYGVAGKGVKLPWYLEKRSDDVNSVDGDDGVVIEESRKKTGKKTLAELKEERYKRERREKERERALIMEKNRDKSRRDGGFSRR